MQKSRQLNVGWKGKFSLLVREYDDPFNEELKASMYVRVCKERGFILCSCNRWKVLSAVLDIRMLVEDIESKSHMPFN